LNFGVVIDLKSAFNAPTVYELSQLVEDLVRNKGENTDLYLDAELIEEGVF
jgi:hypothetical protein